MGKISPYQLFSMMILFQIGTTIVFGFSAQAGRDAWLSALISTLIGLCIIAVYLVLMHLHPGLTLVEWFPAQFGKWIGTPIAWMYPLLFLYDAGRGMGDIKDLMSATILPLTPQIVIVTALIALISYAEFSGIQKIGRLGGIWMPIILLLLVLVAFLTAASGIIDFRHAQPFLGEGWGRVWKSVWPLGITQTFGETIGFAMLWPLVKEQKKIVKVTVTATIVSGVFMCMIDFLAVLVLSEKLFSNSVYPIYTLIQQIEVSNFIENLDAIGVIFFLTTTFFKICIHIFAATYGMQKLLKTKSHQWFIIPAAITVIYLGMTMAQNVLEHLDTGLKILPTNLWIPLFYVLPILLLIVAAVRAKIRSVKMR